MKRYSTLLQWTCLVFLLGCVLFGLINIDFTAPKIYKKDISVINKNINYCSKFSNSSIIDLAGDFLNDLDSLNKDINTAMLEEKILQDKYIKKAEVYLTVEGSIKIYIYFRQPFLQVINNKKLYYYDIEGVRLPDLSNIDQSLLTLSGDINGFFNRDVNIVNNIYEDELLSDLIGGIHYNGEYVLSSRLCDLKINLGSKSLLNTDMVKRIELFLNLLQKKLGCDYCNSINLKYNNQIICVK